MVRTVIAVEKGTESLQRCILKLKVGYLCNDSPQIFYELKIKTTSKELLRFGVIYGRMAGYTSKLHRGCFGSCFAFVSVGAGNGPQGISHARQGLSLSYSSAPRSS